MNIVSVCVIAVFAAMCSVALRKYSPETASLLLAAVVVLTALLALPYAEGVIASVTDLSETAQVGTDYLRALIKAVGVCFLTQLTADICRENGAQSAATQAEMCGRITILLIACPLYADLLSLLSEFLK